jgi:hypothetical protein
MAEIGMNAEAGGEGVALHSYLDELLRRADQAGGEAPLPERPDVAALKQLRVLSGNQLISSTFDRLDELKGLAKDWTANGARVAERLPRWERLLELVKRGGPLPALEGVKSQVAAIEEGRTLLQDPDPLGPVIGETCDVLRGALTTVHDQYDLSFEQAQSALKADSQWAQVSSSTQDALLDQVGLRKASAPALGTEEELLRSLREASIAEWDDRTVAIPARISLIRELAGKELAPKAIMYSPPPATLGTPEAVDTYVTKLREELLAKIKDGPVII